MKTVKQIRKELKEIPFEKQQAYVDKLTEAEALALAMALLKLP